MAGDTTTLYTLDEASPWVHLHPSTIRRLDRTGGIPPGFLTRVGAPGRGGKVFMSGDQIVRLLAHFAEQTAAGPASADPVRRRRRLSA